MSIIKSLANENVDVDFILVVLFKSYASQKKKGALYSNPNNANIAKNLIKMYYTSNHEQSDFDNILDSFKKRYIIQESQLENVHKKEERLGLGLLYDFLSSDDIKKYSTNLLTVILKMHTILYSCVPFKAFGGRFRQTQVYLPSSGVEIPEPDRIVEELLKLVPLYNEIMDLSKTMSNNSNKENEIIEYINKCLKLKAKLIEIHPFENGNGRVCRTLVNYLFKLVNIPPVYVKKSEKIPYENAMSKAILDDDFSNLNTFYYHKICDSINELDISKRNEEVKNKTR